MTWEDWQEGISIYNNGVFAKGDLHIQVTQTNSDPLPNTAFLRPIDLIDGIGSFLTRNFRDSDMFIECREV